MRQPLGKPFIFYLRPDARTTPPAAKVADDASGIGRSRPPPPRNQQQCELEPSARLTKTADVGDPQGTLPQQCP